MEKMLVTQALNELKTLDSRIEREIKNTNFVASAKSAEKKVTPSVTKEEFIKQSKAGYQSITDLIKRREKIKKAVVSSNAKTTVELCGATYTVAEVIDMKSTIGYQESLLSAMGTQLNYAKSDMNKRNALMEEKLDALVSQSFGKESKTSIKEDDYDSIAKPYRAANEYSLVDPLNIEEEIKKLRDYIEEFNSTVDSVLQISNCTTFIEFE